MSSTEILKAIADIAETASKNEKQALFTRYAADREFCRVLEYADNPFKTFGIRQIPEGSGTHSLFLPRMAEAGCRADKTVGDSLGRGKAQKDAAIFSRQILEAAEAIEPALLPSDTPAAQDLDELGLADAALELLDVTATVPQEQAECDEAGNDRAFLDLVGSGIDDLDQALTDGTIPACVALAVATTAPATLSVDVKGADETPRGDDIHRPEGVGRWVAFSPDADLAAPHLPIRQSDLFETLGVGNVERAAERTWDPVRPPNSNSGLAPLDCGLSPPGIPRFRSGGLGFWNVMNVCHQGTCSQVQKHCNTR